MSRLKKLLILTLGAAMSLAAPSQASAQVVIAGPLVPIPTIAPPVVVPSPYPVVTTYRLPTQVPYNAVPYNVVSNNTATYNTAPYVAGYGAYRPVSPAPVYVAPAPVPAPIPVAPAVNVAAPNAVYRPAVVGSSISGLPTVYVPGQPVRNALRYVVP